MEKSNPFPTCFGFNRKSEKYRSTSYEVQLSIMTSDCAEFNLFICAYCLISIISKIFDFVFDPQSVYTVIAGATGIAIWCFGILVYFRCRDGYYSLKSKNIKVNSCYLLVYLILQCLYIAVTITLSQIFYSRVLAYTEIGFLVCISIFGYMSIVSLCWYFFALNLGIATEIQHYNSGE